MMIRSPRNLRRAHATAALQMCAHVCGMWLTKGDHYFVKCGVLAVCLHASKPTLSALKGSASASKPFVCCAAVPCQQVVQRNNCYLATAEYCYNDQEAGGEEAAPFGNVTEALAAAVRDLPPAAKPPQAGKPPERHHPALLAALAAELRCSPGEIVGPRAERVRHAARRHRRCAGAHGSGHSPSSEEQQAALQKCVPCSPETRALQLVLFWCCGMTERSQDCVSAGEGVQMRRVGRAARLTGALRALARNRPEPRVCVRRAARQPGHELLQPAGAPMLCNPCRAQEPKPPCCTLVSINECQTAWAVAP